MVISTFLIFSQVQPHQEVGLALAAHVKIVGASLVEAVAFVKGDGARVQLSDP